MKQIPKYITIIEYISAMTGLSLLFNPSYEDSDHIVYDPGWKQLKSIAGRGSKLSHNINANEFVTIYTSINSIH